MAGATTAAAAGGAASSLPMPGSARRANLEFPPPPPYPPPLHNGGSAAASASAVASCSSSLLDQPSTSAMAMALDHHHNNHHHRYQYNHHRGLVHHSPRSLHDYSYAYYEPGPSTSTCSASLVRLGNQHHPQEYQLLELEQQQQEEDEAAAAVAVAQQSYQSYQIHQHRQDPQKRHTYVTRYGTEENIYEEISEIGRQCRRAAALHGSRRALVEEEVRRVQSRHRRVLGELNLSVEAMLMPTIADQMTGDEDEDGNPDQIVAANGSAASDDILLTSISHHDEFLPDLDSGFSGSSSASYRSGLGSLRRSLGRTSTPELLNGQLLVGCNGQQYHHHHYQHQQHQQRSGSGGKTKAAMIWKKGWKGWKKLQQGLASGGAAASAQKTGKLQGWPKCIVKSGREFKSPFIF